MDTPSSPASRRCSSLANAERQLRTPQPQVSEAQAEAFVLDHYGRRCHARLLVGERDRNFLLRDGMNWQAVLKFYNSADDAPTRAVQNGALDHIQERAPGFPAPEIILALDGRQEIVLETPEVSAPAVMISLVPGVNPVAADLTSALRGNVGRVIGRLSRVLADYDHPRTKRPILWDVMLVGELRPLLELIDQPHRRSDVGEWLVRFAEVVKPAATGLAHQPIHNDLSLSNLLIDPGRRDIVTGVIDFGDIVHAPRINEFAVAASYFVTQEDDPATAVAEILQGARGHVNLEEQEIALLPDLIKARLATRILLSGWRAQLFPGNRDYILRSAGAAWKLWVRLGKEDPARMAARISSRLSEHEQ